MKGNFLQNTIIPDVRGIRDIEFCKSCYYAFPEHYEHIAGKQEKKIELIFENEDIDTYNKIIEIADEHRLSKKDLIKRLLQYAKDFDKRNEDDNTTEQL